jgi:type II secretory ATPase GspE/PulE/Tfp pilus assembly ATPase PilB-like protein
MSIRTAENGDISVGNDLRDVLCLTADGHLYISKTHISSPNVRAFLGRLDKTGETYRVVPCELAKISQLYEAYSGDSGDALSSFQGKAVDLFARAVADNASDIHLSVSKTDATKIKFRINGMLQLIEEHPYDFGQKLCSTIYQSLTDVSAPTFETNAPQDARIADKKNLPDRVNGIRIATGPQVDGFIMVLRLLYNPTHMDLDLLSLGYSENQKKDIEEIEKNPTGITVIAGSTGSGKSTTLQRVLTRMINAAKGSIHAISVEDPPEYLIPGATQTPVANAKTEEDRSAAFQLSIKAAMRLDPDLMMVGEVRDHPSASLAIKAALSGHPLWTTVHANNGFGIITRLYDIGVSMNLLCDPNVISGLICQTLARVLCEHCKIRLIDNQNLISAEDLERYKDKLDINNVYLKGCGCEHCKNTGVTGRTVVAEVIRTSYKLLDLIKAEKIEEATDYWISQGGITMKSHAMSKVNSGICDPVDTESLVGKF